MINEKMISHFYFYSFVELDIDDFKSNIGDLSGILVTYIKHWRLFKIKFSKNNNNNKYYKQIIAS